MRPRAFRVVSILAAVGGLVAGPSDLQLFAAVGGQFSVDSYDLYLEVLIEGTSTGLIARFHRDTDGRFAIDPDELRNVGLTPQSSALRPDGLIDIALLREVSFVYDEANQTIDFVADPGALTTHLIDATPAWNRSLPEPETSFGALVNYAISVNVGGPGSSEPGAGFSTWIEPRIVGRFGTLSSGFVIRAPPTGPSTVTRLDTVWSFSSVERLATYRVGDFISGGLPWTRPVRLGGVQIQRNFDLRPDLVTFPVPQLSGTAAVPSTVEVYINNIRRYSENVPAGPFEIVGLPFVTGAGQARIIVRDELGREQVSETPFYATPKLLAAGILDYSLELGFPRHDFGSASDGYRGQFMTSGTVRYGVSDRLTLEGHIEAGAALLNVGVGAAFSVGHRGVASLAIAGAGGGSSYGVQLAGAVDLVLGSLRIHGAIQRTFGDYQDIASIAAGGCPPAPAPCLADPLRARDQFVLSLPIRDNVAALALSFTNVEFEGGDRSRLVGLTVSRSLARNGSLFATMFADLADVSVFGVAAGFSLALGPDRHLSVNLDESPAGPSVATSLAWSTGDDRFEWRLRDVEGANRSRQATLFFEPDIARIQLGVGQTDGGFQGIARIEGAVVLAGGGFFMTAPIRDGFAVVDVGVPGVPVLFENREAGETNRQGILLIPDVRSYRSNHIAIDPTALPIDTRVGRTDVTVVPANGGMVVAAFDVEERAMAALIVLHDERGDFVAVGSMGSLNGGREDFVVGYDGVAYLTRLAAANSIVVDLPDGHRCQAEFAFAPEAGAQTHIPVLCRTLMP
jgi:outer membrane usher protein